MHAWHQKNQFTSDFPFNLMISTDLEYPPHWHDEIELVYVLEGEIQVGLNNEIHTLVSGDILLIGSGDVHYFLLGPAQGNSQMVILQFGVSLFETMSPLMSNRRFVKPHISKSQQSFQEVQASLQWTLNQIIQEFMNKHEGYLLALKSRLYELMVILLRDVPKETYSDFQRRKQLNRLDRLEQVFHYVEENYGTDIGLSEAAAIANFSVYHFTRFFKEATGMTFGRYLSNIRLRKASLHLLSTGDPVTEVAFRVGFNSIKTFNRLFKEQMGCAPSIYRKGVDTKKQ